MKSLTRYVTSYFHQHDRYPILIISLILSVLIYVNYTYHLNSQLLGLGSFHDRLVGFYLLYLSIFGIGYLFTVKLAAFRSQPRGFYWLLLVAPLIFAAKVAFRHPNLLQWPLKALIVFAALAIVAFLTGERFPFYGLQLRNLRLRPYLYLLLMMMPLLVAASTGADFQRAYPKAATLGTEAEWMNILLFELSYGLDFFTIELFFRGFLILAFIKYLGKGAVLPMAAFYCVIHFGKPVAECISSFFGGLILGAIVYNTRSIWGGLTVHLGIAWMMELIAVVM